MCSEIIFIDYHLLLSIFIVDSALLFMLTLSTTLLKVQIFWVRASRLFLERVMSLEKRYGKAEKGALLKMQEHSQADSDVIISQDAEEPWWRARRDDLASPSQPQELIIKTLISYWYPKNKNWKNGVIYISEELRNINHYHGIKKQPHIMG